MKKKKAEESIVFKSPQQMQEYMDERQRNKFWIQKIWESIYFPIYRFFVKIFDIRRDTRWFIQRGKRGYSDCDLWNFGEYLLKILKEGTGKLKDNHMGHPYNMTDNKWTEILGEMEKGFDKGLMISDGMEEMVNEEGKFEKYRNYTDKEISQFKKEYSQAMSLLKKHIFSLWD
jgi:hypothetical protein